MEIMNDCKILSLKYRKKKKKKPKEFPTGKR